MIVARQPLTVRKMLTPTAEPAYGFTMVDSRSFGRYARRASGLNARQIESNFIKQNSFNTLIALRPSFAIRARSCHPSQFRDDTDRYNRVSHPIKYIAAP